MTATIDVDVLVNCPEWRRTLPKAGAICRQAVAAACRAAGGHSADSEVSIVLADDRMVRDLNHSYRGKDEATNVLAFPAMDPSEQPLPGEPLVLGDIVVAFETTSAEAASAGKRLADHLSHLVVHGVLHLFGFDHYSDFEAARMERFEVTALASLGITDPYALPRIERP